jgi:membrane fusion protein, multidrug efflux system
MCYKRPPLSQASFMIESNRLLNVIAKRRGELFLGFLLVLIAGAAIVVMLKYFVQTDGLKARPVGLPIPVQTLVAKVTSLHEVVGASGTLAESSDVFLTNRVTAKVLKVPVELGNIVKEGNLLAQMDDTLFRSAVDHEQLNLEHATKQLERMLAMQRKSFASEVEVERARTEKAAAQEALDQAQFNLTNTRITAPAAAIVLERTINPGEITSIGNEAFKLGIIDPVFMVAQVSQEKIGSVHMGMHGQVSTDGFPGVVFEGEVVKIDGKVNDTTRTFGVYLKIANHDLHLIPGITGYARLTNERIALAVPSTAVINPVGDKATVYVVDRDNRAHVREIRRGLLIGGMTEVLDGLQEGEEVVTVGTQELRDNDKVSVNQSAPWNK